LIQGQLFFYEYEGMKYITQMDCRNRNGKYKKGSKVSGIAYYQKKDLSLLTTDSSTATGNDPTNPHLSTASNLSREGSGKLNTRVSSTGSAASHRGSTGGAGGGTSSFFHKKHNSLGNSSSSINHILVTTNDNRIRLCSLEDYSTVCKYKGLKNRSMQIKSTLSDDCDYIICGSEYGQVFIWKTFDDNMHHFNSKMLFNSFLGKKDILRNKLYENFDANEDGNAVICAIFTPIESVRRYVKSHKELLYELLQNSNISSYWLNEGGSASGSHQDGNTLSSVLLGGIAAAGNNTGSEQSTSQRNSGVLPPVSNNSNKVADLVSLGLGTRIICTADFNGQIRVFFRIN
jgi:hypothetical protein